MASNISSWLGFALQQMAAESYLNGIDWENEQQVTARLRDGNNNRLITPEESFLGNTRFADLQAAAFLDHYKIIDQHASDATGFSATLIKDLSDPTEKTFTLSFRSLEYQGQAKGGDWERDGIDGAAGEIAGRGFAFAQLVSMERYWKQIQPTLPAGAILNVTGYSLGGHLATVFTELHADRVNHTYTFNAAGRGAFANVLLSETQEIARIWEMVTYLDTQIQQFDPSGLLMESGASGNLYADARYNQALLSTQQLYLTVGTSMFVSPGGVLGGVTRTGGPFDKISQLFGHAASGADLQIIANSGVMIDCCVWRE